MIRFLAIDLDGTLLRSDKSISDYSISVLRQCRKEGILAAFATARSLPSAQSYLSRFMPAFRRRKAENCLCLCVGQ